MICNLCGAQEASIHLTEIINNQMIEVHLCEACAEEKGTDFKTHFNFADLFSNLIPEPSKPAAKPSEKRFAGKCPQCGMTYDEFGKTGRLGCAACYEAFSRLLLPLIKRVQRSTRHVGKTPSKAAASAGPVGDLKALQDKLRKSIQAEDFEEAARLRDQIKQMDEALKKIRKGKND